VHIYQFFLNFSCYKVVVMYVRIIHKKYTISMMHVNYLHAKSISSFFFNNKNFMNNFSSQVFNFKKYEQYAVHYIQCIRFIG